MGWAFGGGGVWGRVRTRGALKLARAKKFLYLNSKKKNTIKYYYKI
jgi:hypothetical protein